MTAGRVVELFAGVGGFRLALERAGWQVAWSNQWEPSTHRQHASDCYVARFGPEGHSNDDITHVLDAVERGDHEIPDHDLLVGGTPCQDYSVARPLNQADGLVGRKGVLWWQVHRLIEQRRPRLLLLENVDRMLKSPADRRGRDFAVMLSALGRLGYEVEWRVANAADYGFPQKRRRVFIVGRLPAGRPGDPREVLDHGVLARALPTGSIETAPAESFDVGVDPVNVSGSFGARRGPSPFRKAGFAAGGRVWTVDVTPTWAGPRQVLGDILEPAEQIPSAYLIPDEQVERWAYLKGAKREPRVHRQSGTPYAYVEGAIPFPDPIDRPSRTILTGEGGVSPSRFKHVVAAGDGRYRRLTPRELERLNGFPDDWTDTGIAEGRRAFLMGNALVVGLVERIGRELARESPSGAVEA